MNTRTVVITFILGTILAVTSNAAVLIVNPGNPAPFNDINSTIQAAFSGDVILVAPGTYNPFQVNKAVRIHPQFITQTYRVGIAPGTPSIRIGPGINLPGYCIVEGFEINGWKGQSYAIHIKDVQGTVLIKNGWIKPSELFEHRPSSVPSAIVVDNSSKVYMDNINLRQIKTDGTGLNISYFGGGQLQGVHGAIVKNGTEVIMSHCDIKGLTDIDDFGGNGINVTNSTAWIDGVMYKDTKAEGGNGGRAGGHGVVASNATVRKHLKTPPVPWKGGIAYFTAMNGNAMVGSTFVSRIRPTLQLRRQKSSGPPPEIADLVSIGQNIKIDMTADQFMGPLSYVTYQGYNLIMNPAGLPGGNLIDGLPCMLDFSYSIPPLLLSGWSGTFPGGSTIVNTYTYQIPIDPNLIGGEIFLQAAYTTTPSHPFTWSELLTTVIVP